MKIRVLIGFLYLSMFVYGQAHLIDSLQLRAERKDLNDTLIIDTYTQLGNLLVNQERLEEGLAYGEKALQRSMELKYSKGELNGINVMALCYGRMGKFDESVQLFEKYISLAKARSVERGVMQGNNNLGLTYYQWGKYDKALTYHFNALEVAEKLDDQASMAVYYNNISRVYYANAQYDEAISYCKRALEMERLNNGSPVNVLIRGINLSSYYNEANRLDESTALLLEMLAYNDSTVQHELYGAYLHANLGDTYFRMERYQDAIKETNIGYLVFTKSSYSPLAAQLDVNLARSYAKLGAKSNAISHLEKGLQVADEGIDLDFQRYAYESAGEVYAAVGNYKLALEYTNRGNALKDSLTVVEKSNAIIDMQTKYETKQKEDSIVLQKFELENQMLVNREIEKKSSQKTRLLWLAVIVVALFLLFMFILVRLYRKTRQQKEKIEQKNHENELLLGEIHHRVKNNLQVISSLLSLQEKNISDEKAKAAILEGKERVQSMGLIHKLLYQQNDFSGIDMNEYVNKLVSGLLASFGKRAESFQLNTEFKKIVLDVDTAVPLGLIINELVVNALKYAFEKTDQPHLAVKLAEIDDQLVLEIADNGAGKLASLDKSESFGMKLIKSLSKQLNGTINIEESSGLRFKLAFKDYKLAPYQK